MSAVLPPRISLPQRVVTWLDRLAPLQAAPAGAARAAAPWLRRIRGWTTATAADEACVGHRLVVRSGLHAGATLALTDDELSFGSDPGCDIVLHDAVLRPRHGRLVLRERGYEVLSIDARNAGGPRPLRTVREGNSVEVCHDLGGIEIALLHEAEPVGAPAHDAGHWASQGVRSLVAALLLAALALAAGRWLADFGQPSASEIVATGTQELAGLSLRGVRMRQASDGAIEVVGIVAGDAERQRLDQWLGSADRRGIRLAVRDANELVDELTHALAAPELRVSFAEGRLRVEGATTNLATRMRLHTLAKDLASVIPLDDRVVLIEAADRLPAREVPLPVRITDVMSGPDGYFRTDTGARYFVGGLLPDGAEVLAIEASGIAFRRAGRLVVHSLE